MAYKIFITLSLTIFYIASYTQENSSFRPNATFFGIGKNGFVQHISYERQFIENKFGITASIASNVSFSGPTFANGIGAFRLFGRHGKYLELGADIFYYSSDSGSNDVVDLFSLLVYPQADLSTYYISANIGYRRYRGGKAFKIGLSPGFIKNYFVPGAYISFGFTY